MNKESWVEGLQSRLGKLNTRIKELRKKAEDFGDDLSQEYREQLEGLRTRTTKSKERLKEMQEKGGKVPENLRTEVEEKINKIEKSYEDLKKKLTLERGVEMEVDKTQRISVQKLIGMKVLDSQANDFGQIDDVFINVKEGKIEDVVIKTGIRRRRYKLRASEIEKIGDQVILNVEREMIEERKSEE